MKPGQRTQFERTIDQAERDAEMARWRVANHATYQQVADHFGLRDKSRAHDAIQRAIAAAAAKGGREALAAEIVKLDALEEAAWAVLRANHIYVSDGRVVKDDGAVITDHKPVLMAIDRLVRIAERRSKLLGLDAPARQVVTVITEDVVDAEIRKLNEELANATDSDA